MFHVWQPWWNNMVIFGSITRQYFQKCKLAWALKLFFREMTINILLLKNEKKTHATSDNPVAWIDSKNAKNEKWGQKYLGIDTNIVRLVITRGVRENIFFSKRTRNFCYRAKIWLDHFSKKIMSQYVRNRLGYFTA